MIIKVEFAENNQSFNTAFGEMYSAPDENYNKGYEAGYPDGYQNGYDEGNAEGVKEGIAEGKEEEYNKFWDAFQQNGNRTRYYYAFFQWGGDTVRPKYKIAPTDSASLNQTFCESKFKKIESAYFDFSQKKTGTWDTVSAYYTFATCPNLEEIEDIGLFDGFKYCSTFSWSTKLHTIAKIGVAETTQFSNAFNGCAALENLTIDGVIGQNGFNVSWSTKLSAKSIKSIINALSDTATGKTLTLSQTAVNNAFTDAEWTALANTKTNWTITLV